MKPPPRRYEIVIPPGYGQHRPARVLSVTRTGQTGPHGRPVYAAASETFRVEITDDGLAWLLDDPHGLTGHLDPAQTRGLHATPSP